MRLLEVSEAEAAALTEQANGAPPDALTRVMEILSESEGRFRDATSKKILLEVALMKAIQGRQAMSIDAVLGKLEELRGQGGDLNGGDEAGGVADFSAMRQNAGAASSSRSSGGAVPKAAAESARQVSPAAEAPAPASAASQPASPKPAAPAAAARPATEPIAAGAEIDLDSLWPQIVESVGRASPFLKTYLPEAHPVSFQKNVLTIGFDPEFAQHLALVSNPRNQTLFQTKLKELGFPDAQVKFVEAEAPERWKSAAPASDYSFEDSSPVGNPEPAEPGNPVAAEPSPAAAPEPVAEAAPEPPAEPLTPESVKPMDMDDFKNDPLIKKALETFRGQIVDVRS